jgi:iron complex outermembrane receptor protein
MNSLIPHIPRRPPVLLLVAIALSPSWVVAQVAAQQNPTPAPAALPTAQLDVLIVTGSRVEGRTAESSPVPVDLLPNTQIETANETNLLDSLNTLLPSFNVPNVQTPDIPSMIRAGELRGLGADNTLVLVNGKRRHPSAFLQTSGYFAGEAPVDLSLIPEGSIANIEVLRDGASAIYGSDAIAGVINILTKNADNGGEASFRTGQYYKGDGLTRVGIVNDGFAFGSAGHVNVTAEVDDKQAVVRNFPIPSSYLLYFPLNAQGQQVKTGPNYSLPAGDTPSPQEATRNNNAWINTGSAAYRLDSLSVDFGTPISSGVNLYGFGTYDHRTSQSAQNFRQQARLEDVLSIYPDGFTPYEAIREDDLELTGGIKGKDLLGWDWDLSGSFAQDDVDVYTLHSVNPTYGSLSPTNFYDGANSFSSVTDNLDLRRSINTPVLPLDVSLGFESRYEEFKIKPGELASWSYAGQNPADVTQLVYPSTGPFSLTGSSPTRLPLSDAGSQALPGFRPQDSVDAHRSEFAFYAGASAHVNQAWIVDLAGRYEDYSDAGSTLAGRLSSRYDFSPLFGLRATVSNGFHAPALAVDNYRNTANINTYQQHTLAVNSTQAQALGARPLVPETSHNYSVGIVSNPTKTFSIALDAYQINLNNLITASTSIRDTDSAGHPTTAGTAADALVTGDGFASGDGVGYFINACNTRTEGLELTFDKSLQTTSLGDFQWTVAASANRTVLTGVAAPHPAILQQAGISLFNASSQSSITYPGPREKLVFGVDWKKGDWSFDVHETYYGIIKRIGTPSTVATSGPYAGLTQIPENVDPIWVTDLALTYRFAKGWSVSLNANNLFNAYPSKIPQPFLSAYQSASYANFGPVGAAGGFYSTTVTYKF